MDRPSDFLWVRLVSGFPVYLRGILFANSGKKYAKTLPVADEVSRFRGSASRFDRQSHFRPTYSPVYPSAAESIRPAAVTCSTARRNSSECVLRSMPTIPTVQRTAPSTP